MRKRHHILIGMRIQGIYHRKGELSLSHIVASRLPYLLRVVIIEYVIAYLEDYSEVLAKFSCRLNLLLRGSGRLRTDYRTSLEKGRRLALNHLIINFFRYFAPSVARQLQYFAVGKRLAQLGKIAHDGLRVGTRHILQGRRKDIIAHQYSHLIIIHSVDRSLSAPLRTFIHHIVMHKRCRMQQFQSHSSILRNLAHTTKVLRHQQYQDRPHTLSGTLLYIR